MLQNLSYALNIINTFYPNEKCRSTIKYKIHILSKLSITVQPIKIPTGCNYVCVLRRDENPSVCHFSSIFS